jgi:hypothetical protein
MRIKAVVLLATLCVISSCTNSTDLSLGAFYSTGAGIAKDTLIIKADSTERRISEIVNAEMILSELGTGKSVSSIIKGLGRSLLLVKTDTGRSILIGGDQPIKTSAGWDLVGEIKIGTIVECIDGQEEIVQIHEINYNAQIYNLEFDGETGIYGNGFLIGDYGMMRRMREENELIYFNP